MAFYIDMKWYLPELQDSGFAIEISIEKMCQVSKTLEVLLHFHQSK